MTFPITSLVAEHRELGLVVAVLLGFGFGFVLERAGFGQAKKLAAQFYLHDMTVFKVMFSAIVTAMLGLLIASGLGFADLAAISASAASWTYLGPMVAGGFLLGVGFIVSGYCPGTSIVATASGNLDGLMTVGGVVVGSVLYSELYPYVESLHNATNFGHVFLYDLVGLPPQVVGLLVALMAVGCFIGAEKVERIFTKRRGAAGEESPARPRRLVFATFGALTGLALVTLTFPPAPEASVQAKARPIAQPELARRLLDEPWSLRVVDVRAREACARQRIPGSECLPAATLGDVGLAYAPASKDLVVVTADASAELPAAALTFPGRVYALEDGFAGWKRSGLPPRAPRPGGADESTREQWRLQAGLAAAMTGVKQAPPPPTDGVKFVPKKKKKGGGCN